jgi:hypothetical protein
MGVEIPEEACWIVGLSQSQRGSDLVAGSSFRVMDVQLAYVCSCQPLPETETTVCTQKDRSSMWQIYKGVISESLHQENYKFFFEVF